MRGFVPPAVGPEVDQYRDIEISSEHPTSVPLLVRPAMGSQFWMPALSQSLAPPPLDHCARCRQPRGRMSPGQPRACQTGL